MKNGINQYVALMLMESKREGRGLGVHGGKLISRAQIYGGIIKIARKVGGFVRFLRD